MSATAVLTPTPTNAFPTHVNTSSPMEDNTHHTSEEEESRFAFLYNFKQERLSNIRPASDFFDRNRFKYTTSFQLISERWK